MSSSKAKPKKTAPQAGSKNLLQNIFFGGTAGVIGQASVFPLYTVKTRLHLYPGRYNNVFHCARKIVQHDGLRGLYRGMPPAVIGVFPEKAIKLSMNDYLTAVLARPDGTISLPMAMLAGGGAGFSQVIVTNPMELVMITMQSNAARGRKPKSMFHLARDLGLSGLYRGTQATLLRDVPFSMIFFSLNTHLRSKLADDDGKIPLSRTFLAGIAAGSTASSLSTPMDVIKTRLQAGASERIAKPSTTSVPTPSSSIPNTTSPSSSIPSAASAARAASGVHTRSLSSSPTPAINYTGIMHCARHIYATEGLVGFMAGVVPRVLTISPLFGITLFFYDVQRRLQESGRI